MKRPGKRTRIILLLSGMHFLIDFLCAFTVYSRLNRSAVTDVVLYNFCAFVLQMPLGLLADLLNFKKKEQAGLLFSGIGAALTVFGTFTFIPVLGLGNALFHVGGGIITIHQDDALKRKGKGLGTFVAPGAIGLFLGQVLAKYHVLIQFFAIAALAVLYVRTYTIVSSLKDRREKIDFVFDSDVVWTIILCSLVVVIRSYVGFAVAMPWRKGFLISLLAVLCVALGKTAGGFLGAFIGYRKTIIITLIASAAFYGFCDNAIAGLLALLFFNMSMPVTLYLLAKKMPQLEGFAFGILTCALFVGYYIKAVGLVFSQNTHIVGILGSLISIAMLVPLTFRVKRKP